LERVDDCAIRCENNCPSGLKCTEEGYCVHTGFKGTCPDQAGAGGQGGSSDVESGGEAASAEDEGGAGHGDAGATGGVDDGGAVSAGGADGGTGGGAQAGQATGGQAGHGNRGGTTGGVTGTGGGTASGGAAGATGGVVRTGGHTASGGTTASATGGLAGAGGRTASGGATASATGGLAGAGGTTAGGAEQGGAGGATGGCGSNEPLSIEVTAPPAPLCEGEPGSAELAAHGGQEPYAWSLVQPSSEVELASQNGASELTANFTSLGEHAVDVRVTDDCGTSVVERLDFDVHEVPSVVTGALPSACPGQIYRALLQASGGDPSSYHWSVEPVVPGLTVTVDGAEINAAVPLENENENENELVFKVSVADEFCSSAEKQLSIEIEPYECPRIQVLDPYGRELVEPRAPCKGAEYTVRLGVQGGAPPYVWEADSLPPGLVFEPEGPMVGGIAADSGPLLLELRDADDRRTALSADLVVREKCWLGFVATGESPARLDVWDPLLGTLHTFPSTPSTSVVESFDFSPDGHRIAYQSLGAGDTKTLAIVDLSTFDETPVALEGSVLRYGWSPDSQVLAIGFDAAQGSALGGLRLSGSDAPSPLVPQLVPVESELRFFGDDSVAFHAPAEEGSTVRAVRYAELGGTGFSPAVTITPFYSAPVIKAGDGGFFVTDLEAPSLDFYAVSGSYPTRTAHGFQAIAPSGRYTGRANDDGNLELFRPIDPSTNPEAVPWTSAPGCPMLLAWAEGRERIACVAGVDEGGEVRIFDVGPDGKLITPATVVLGAYTYDENTAFERRRAFSPSGNWFVFTGDGQVYVADLRDRQPRVRQTITELDTSGSLELSFSSDETTAVFWDGTDVFASRLEDGPCFPMLESALPVSPCNETFLSPAWCGRDTDRAGFSWAPEALLVSFLRADGRLAVYGFELLSLGSADPFYPEPDYEFPLGSSHRFQP
jgi:hypothetical protein